MEVNGLPLHVLVIHAAVVLGPLAGLTGVLYAAVPRWRGQLRWPLVVLAAVAGATAWVAVLSGQDFLEDPRFATAQGAFADKLELHEERGERLRWIASGFAVVAFASAWWHTRRGPVGVLLGVALAALGVLTVVWTVLTGDAGAQAVWGA
jgi:hypothetical protein